MRNSMPGSLGTFQVGNAALVGSQANPMWKEAEMAGYYFRFLRWYLTVGRTIVACCWSEEKLRTT
jgi:hypothetical protein